MRTLKDKCGLAVQIGTISGDDAYSGMLEGTPYLARKFRLLQGRRQMQQQGVYVDGLDELECEIAGLDRQCEIWAPNERWHAKLVTSPDWSAMRRNYLHVHWFQQGGDPLARLEEIVADLDFAERSNVEAVHDDD